MPGSSAVAIVQATRKSSQKLSKKKQKFSRVLPFVSFKKSAAVIASTVSKKNKNHELYKISSFIDDSKERIIDENDKYLEFSKCVYHVLQTLDEDKSAKIVGTDLTRTDHNSCRHAGIKIIDECFYRSFDGEEPVRVYKTFDNGVSWLRKMYFHVLIDDYDLNSI